MSTYGIAGFVEGFMGGVDTAHRWKDRKRDQKRQDKLDGMTEEEHKRRMRLLDQSIAANDKAVADQKFYEDTFKGAVDATNASMQPGAATGPAGGPVPAAAAGATSGLPPPSGILPATLPLGLPVQPGDRTQSAPAGMPTPAEMQRRYGEPASSPGVVNAPVVSATGPAGGPVPGPVPTPAPSGDPIANAGLIRQPSGTYIAPAPRGIIADELAAAGAGTGVRYLPDPAAVAGKKAEAEIAAQKNAQDAELERLRRVRDEDGPIPLAWRREADTKIGDLTKQSTAANPNPALDTAPMSPAALPPGKSGMEAMSDAWKTATKSGRVDTSRDPAINFRPVSGNAPASAPPEVKTMADTAATAMASTTTPAMAATAAAAAKGLPEKPKPAPTEADRSKYAGDFMDQYRKVGAPMVYEALISKGEFAKAEAFREFLDKDATKAGMENWARAAFAASTGDMDTFANEIMKAYDRLDYFPDGTTIVRDQSGFTRDKDGNITGAKLTFKDENTGNTFDQVFSDPNDLVRLGITLLAPEQAFEYYFEQQKAATEAAKGLAKTDAEAAKDQQKRVDEVAKMIYESSVGIDGLPTISYGDALKQAEEQLSGAPAASGPPVARRPEG